MTEDPWNPSAVTMRAGDELVLSVLATKGNPDALNAVLDAAPAVRLYAVSGLAGLAIEGLVDMGSRCGFTYEQVLQVIPKSRVQAEENMRHMRDER